jgi:hypothetical protein
MKAKCLRDIRLKNLDTGATYKLVKDKIYDVYYTEYFYVEVNSSRLGLTMDKFNKCFEIVEY